MSGISKKKLTILILAGCIVVIFGVKSIIHMLGTPAPGILTTARTKGTPQAGLRIVEYSDFQCPSCAKGSVLLDSYFKKYPGAIFLELKYFPLRMHSHAFMSARYAQCAARQGKFWPFHDLLIQRQKQWRGLFNAEPAFQIMSRETGLNQKELRACLGNKEVDAIIMKDKEEGQSLGIKSTPTYFLNNKIVVGSKTLKKKLTAYFNEKSGQ